MLGNRRGQVGETATWLVATIVIVLVLLFFIFTSTLLAESKGVQKYKESLSYSFNFEGLKLDNIFIRKTTFSYYLTSSDDDRFFMDDYLEKDTWGIRYYIDFDEDFAGRLKKND